MAAKDDRLAKKKARVSSIEEKMKAMAAQLEAAQKAAQKEESTINADLWRMIGRGISSVDDLTANEREVVKGILGRRKWKKWERTKLVDWLPAGSDTPDELGASGDGSPSTPGQHIPDAVNLPGGSPAAAG
jgi:hypothetical protein